MCNDFNSGTSKSMVTVWLCSVACVIFVCIWNTARSFLLKTVPRERRWSIMDSLYWQKQSQCLMVLIRCASDETSTLLWVMYVGSLLCRLLWWTWVILLVLMMISQPTTIVDQRGLANRQSTWSTLGLDCTALLLTVNATIIIIVLLRNECST